MQVGIEGNACMDMQQQTGGREKGARTIEADKKGLEVVII